MNTEGRNDVLEAFVAEPLHNESTLSRYVQRYPDHATDLIELAFLVGNLVESDDPITEHDENRIESAWAQMRYMAEAASNEALKQLTQHAAKVARNTGLPPQVITMTRERIIEPASLTRSFLRRVGEAADVSPDVLRAALSGPPLATARSFSSQVIPKAPQQVPLRQILEDAHVAETFIDELLKDE